MRSGPTISSQADASISRMESWTVAVNMAQRLSLYVWLGGGVSAGVLSRASQRSLNPLKTPDTWLIERGRSARLTRIVRKILLRARRVGTATRSSLMGPTPPGAPFEPFSRYELKWIGPFHAPIRIHLSRTTAFA